MNIELPTVIPEDDFWDVCDDGDCFYNDDVDDQSNISKDECNEGDEYSNKEEGIGEVEGINQSGDVDNTCSSLDAFRQTVIEKYDLGTPQQIAGKTLYAIDFEDAQGVECEHIGISF